VWNGDLLDSRDTVLKFAKTMTWKGNHPKVQLVEKQYASGVKLTRKQMEVYETAIERFPGLKKWFVLISPELCMQTIA
jgi:hypothetical protein